MISDWTKSESRFRLLAFLAILGSIGPHVSLADTPRAAQKSMSGEAPATSPEVARMLSDAREAIRTGNLPLAIIQLKNAVNAAPRNGLVRVQLALADLMGGNYPDAESQLRQARIDHAPDQAVLPPLFDAMLARGEAQQLLAEFPDPGPHAKESSAPDVLKARAVALLRVGQPQQAVAEMDQSLAYRRDVSGLLTRAKIAQEEKDIGTAQKLADEALGRDSKSLDALVFEISLAMQSRHDAQALALAERLVHDYPDNLAARSARIEVYLKQKMDAKAKPEVDAILAVHPTLPAAVYYRAILLARAGRTRDAWGVAESLPPEFVQAQAGTAMAVAELAAANKDYETAGAILASALAKHPDDLNIRLRLAATRLQQNSAENALNILLPMKDSGDPRLQSLLAETYLKLHRWSDALAYLEKAAAVPGVSPLLKEQLAETQMQVGQEDTAIKELTDLAAEQPTNVEAAGQLIAALSRAKRFDDALKAADTLGHALPKSPAPGFYRGEILFAKRDFTGALAAFNGSLGNDPHFLPSLYYRAGVFGALGRYDEGDRDLQQILARDPKNVQVLVKDAEFAVRRKHDGDVPSLLGRAIAASPEDPGPRLALANFYLSKRNLVAARKTDDDLLHIHPNNPEALALSGSLQWAAGQKASAVETYRRLDSLMPKSVAVKLLLANALSATGDAEGAENTLETAVKDNPDSVQVRRALITLKSASGDHDGAIGVANDYAAGHNSTDADLLLADALLRGHQTDKAIAVLKKSIAERPEKHALTSLTNVLSQNGRTEEARKLLADWVDQHPADIDVRRQYATLLLQIGDNDASRAQYEIVVRGAPGDAVSLNNLGWLLQKDQPARAVALVTQAVTLAPNSPDIVDTLGWLKFSQNDRAGALPLLQQAHNLRKADGEISFHLAVALDATGKRADAKALLQSVLASGTKFADYAKAEQMVTTWR